MEGNAASRLDKDATFAQAGIEQPARRWMPAPRKSRPPERAWPPETAVTISISGADQRTDLETGKDREPEATGGILIA